MKQTMKRISGTLIVIALLSGLTGAFAFSLASKAINGNQSGTSTPDESLVEEQGIMTLSKDDSMPTQHIDLTKAAEKACTAVVYIKVTIAGEKRTIEYSDPFSDFDDFFGEFFGRRGQGGTQRRQIETPKRQGAGSGVLISSDGYIVTNNHVVENATEIAVTLNDSREYTARVIGLDPDTDLALLKIDGSDFPTLTIGDSDALKVGEWVLAVGNPFNLTSTVTAGIVSAKARGMGANKGGIESYIQTDAAINAGNSGGALVNARGELIGINAMLYSQTGSFTGYGFAIPTTIVKKVVNDLQQYGKVQRAMFGVSGMTLHDYIEAKKAEDEQKDVKEKDKFKADFGTNEGVYIAEVTPDGAAAEAGLKEGDVIVSVDGKKITKMSELQESTTKYHPGDKATVGYIRDKKELTTTVTFKNSQGGTKVVKPQNFETLGAEFKELSDALKKDLKMSYGVQVTSLSEGPLKKAGIEKDFIIMQVNNQNIKTVSDLESAFKSAQNSETRTLFIWGKYPSGKTGSFAVELGDE
ncbi:MAG: Do family serine endopeptidase [Prevotellaceae bacterium]|nr:Do family serine endopeptidase [Candidatus Colivivens equi]